jgi:lipoprotein-releasing system ATP-binding protein
VPEKTLLELEDITKSYPAEPEPAAVLRGISMRLETGETAAVIGPSGCGKSTLLNIIGLLDEPDSGALRFRDQDLRQLSHREAARFRNRETGFVFQLHHLLPQCTVLENVLVPSIVNADAEKPEERARRLLDRVGLSDRMDYRPGSLSGGERQRAAVVRALINQPALLLADEPTGSLNEEGADALAELLLELNREENMTLLVVTHAPRVAGKMGHILHLHEGVLETEG